MNNILSDRSKFRTCNEPFFKLVFRLEDRINRFLKTLRDRKIITDTESSSLHVRGSSLGSMYGLPKIHKHNVPLRPIMAGYSSANYKLAKYLIPLLRPLASNGYSLSNSYEFVNKVRTQNSNLYMVSYDVTSLFTNVPLRDTINIIMSRLFPTPSSVYKGFDRTTFKRALELATLDSYFTFNNNTYQQCDGVAMGSPLGPILANIFMCDLEEKFLTPNLTFKPQVYLRYVDDTFALFNDPSHATQFLNLINSMHPNIVFTMETEQNSSLPFLDVLVKRHENSFQTSVFRKKTFTGLGFNFQSFTSKRFKLNSISTLVSRAYHISSSYINFHNEIELLKNYFTNNGYPSSVFFRKVHTFLHNLYNPKDRVPTVPKLTFYSSMPFLGPINRNFERELMSLLNKFYPYINFKLAFNNNFTIGSLFTLKDRVEVLRKSGVVYLYTCSRCNLGNYVGSTTRLLFTRICAHRGISYRSSLPLSDPEFSAIRTHSNSCGSDIESSDFRCLGSCSNDRDLRTLESMFVKKLHPVLNNNSSSSPLHVF